MVKNILKHILKCNLIVIVLLNIYSFTIGGEEEQFRTLIVIPILMPLIIPLQFYFMYITYDEDFYK